jgi:hypothetical protein
MAGRWLAAAWNRTSSTVASLCSTAARSPVSARAARSCTPSRSRWRRTRASSARTADSLLDSASFGARWLLLSPAPAAAGRGVVAGSQARHNALSLRLARLTQAFSLVGGVQTRSGPTAAAP